jgi:hypothetical protein
MNQVIFKIAKILAVSYLKETPYHHNWPSVKLGAGNLRNFLGSSALIGTLVGRI